MTRTWMHSLHDCCGRMNGRRAGEFVVIFAVIFALLGTACGHDTPGAGPLFPAPDGSGWGFIDSRGKNAIAPRFESVLPFSEGLAAVKREGRWGYIDRKGNGSNSLSLPDRPEFSARRSDRRYGAAGSCRGNHRYE